MAPYPLYRRLGEPQDWSGRVRKIRPYRGAWIPYDVELYCSTVRTVFQNCCSSVSFMSGRSSVRAGEGPKDKEKMKMMSLEKVEILDKLDR
jgi:hypothetical protein